MIYELTPVYDRCKSFYGKAYIKESKQNYILISYETEILKLNKNTNKLTFLCKNIFAYSKTTNRHINEFLRQYTNEHAKSKNELIKMSGARFYRARNKLY